MASFFPEVILQCVRWYCRYALSYRDLEEMMRERGLEVDDTTLYRCVQVAASLARMFAAEDLSLAEAAMIDYFPLQRA